MIYLKLQIYPFVPETKCETKFQLTRKSTSNTAT